MHTQYDNQLYHTNAVRCQMHAQYDIQHYHANAVKQRHVRPWYGSKHGAGAADSSTLFVNAALLPFVCTLNPVPGVGLVPLPNCHFWWSCTGVVQSATPTLTPCPGSASVAMTVTHLPSPVPPVMQCG